MDPMEEMKKLPPEVLKKLPPEMQALIAAKVTEALKQFEAKVLGDVRTESWISRAWRELTLPKAQPLELASVKAKQDGLRHGMLCLMACKDSGFKARKNVKGMTEVDIQAKADLTVSEVLLIQVLVLAAEKVIERHGLEKEYRSIVDKIETELRPMYPMPTAAEMEKMNALIAKDKGGENGKLPEIGERSEPAVDTEGVRDNQQESKES